MVSFSLRQRIFLPPPTGPHSGVLSFQLFHRAAIAIVAHHAAALLSFYLCAWICSSGGLHSARARGADPNFNTERTLCLARRASDTGAAIALFPELGISAYSNEDLFHQDVLLDATKAALARVIEESQGLSPLLLVGAPLRFEGKLFNCALVIYRGRLLGIVPKTFLPNYREFYEKRQFTSGRNAVGVNSIFRAKGSFRQRSDLRRTNYRGL